MKWLDLLKIVGNQPVIETKMLAGHPSDLPKVEVQLSRWVKTGRLIKIKKGTYLLSEHYRKTPIKPDYISTLVHKPSYISLSHALADYGLIPEMIPAITLVTTKRPCQLKVEGKLFIYRHIKKSLFWGYEERGEKNFETFYATPEKALMDYFYFARGNITEKFLDEMRLQNTEVLDIQKLIQYAKRFESRKISRAVEKVCQYIEEEGRLKQL